MALGLACFDALVELAEGIADGDGDALTKPIWHALVTSLEPDRQKLFPRDVYGVLEKSDGNAREEFFGLFGDMLSNRELLAGSPEFIRLVCRPILEAGNQRGIEWLADIAAIDSKVLTGHRDQIALNDFADRVRQRLRETPESDPTYPNLKRLGSAIGL